MHEVRRLKPTICEIFTKMPKNILSCLNNRLQLILVDGKKYVLIQKILIACRQLLLAKRREAVHLTYAVNFKVLLISVCTLQAMVCAVNFYQNYCNHSLELISSLVFTRKAFGSVKTSYFVFKNIARAENFTS